MKTIEGWWFGPEDRKLGYSDGRTIIIGETHHVDAPIVPCKRGLHLSVMPIDALKYTSGPIIYRVQGSGIIIPHGNPIDKYACSDRTYIAGGIDITDTLRKFARWCALRVVNLWDAPAIVKKYLETGDDSLRSAARSAAAADAAYWSVPSSWSAAAAAADAARSAAYWSAASSAAAARSAAYWSAAAWNSQNKKLEDMILKIIPTG